MTTNHLVKFTLTFSYSWPSLQTAKIHLETLKESTVDIWKADHSLFVYPPLNPYLQSL